MCLGYVLVTGCILWTRRREFASPSNRRHQQEPHSERVTKTPVEIIYERLAPVYDVIYGATLAPGSRRAMTRLAPANGELILEVGVGTGLSAVEYPTRCRVVAVDLSPVMLDRARSRFARLHMNHVALCRMDAAHLGFPDRRASCVTAASRRGGPRWPPICCATRPHGRRWPAPPDSTR